MSKARVVPTLPLQEILHPATKEKLFRHGHKEEREHPREQGAPYRRDQGMEMEKAEEQSDGHSDGRIGGQRA